MASVLFDAIEIERNVNSARSSGDSKAKVENNHKSGDLEVDTKKIEIIEEEAKVEPSALSPSSRNTPDKLKEIPDLNEELQKTNAEIESVDVCNKKKPIKHAFFPNAIYFFMSITIGANSLSTRIAVAKKI